MPRIIIAGAGIAGLNAALTLHDAGLACAVYEAAERVGGRIHSLGSFWADGMVSEWCGEFIDHADTTLHQLTSRFGLREVALDSVPTGHAPGLLYLGGRFAGPDDLERDFQAIASILGEQFQAAGYPTAYDHSTLAGRALDRLSARAWIERFVPGGPESALGRFLSRACGGLYGLDAGEQSALNLVYLFGARAESGGAITPRPMLGSSKIAGGNARLPGAIAAALPESSIHLGRRLVAIERTAVGPLTLTFATADGGAERVECEYTILALPFSALRRVDYVRAGFDERKRAAIEQLGYGTISKLCLEFDRPYWFDDGPWPRPHSGFAVTDLEVQTFWDTSLGQAGAHGLLVNYTSGRQGAAFAPPAAYTTTDDTAVIGGYARACLAQLERLFPGISARYTGRAALSYPPGDPNLLGSYACWRVGQYTAFAGYEGARQGPVLFAGEQCSIERQGYMEGAAREGERAAREIIGELGG